MKLLFGTTNPSKLNYVKKLLEGLNVEIIGLSDVKSKKVEICESGKSPLENARIKALGYYRAYRMPVFSCDSGLYIDGLSEHEQPGVYVRRVNGKVLTDDEMIEYYSKIAYNLGGSAKAKYKNAVCIVFNENEVYGYDADDMSEWFILTSKPHAKRDAGFPLNSLSIDIKTNKYYMDLTKEDAKAENEKQDNGLRKFFVRTVLQYAIQK